MWKKSLLRRSGYNLKPTVNLALDILENPYRIPYLGHWNTSEFAAPEMILSLAPKDRESELSVRNYRAMLEMLKEEKGIIDRMVNIIFRNFGTSGLGRIESAFLMISAEEPGGHKERINFTLEDPKTYLAFWSWPFSRIQQRMMDYRGPSINNS